MKHNLNNITTVEDAFAYLNRKEHLDLSRIPAYMHNSFKAFYRLTTVIEALNDSWIPDTNKNATMDGKYILVAEMYHGDMQYHGYHVAKSLLDLSHSRLFAFRSLEVVEHFSVYFLDVYKDFMLATNVNSYEGSAE